MRRAILLCSFAAILVSCTAVTAPEPQIITQTVDVPVAASCVIDTVPAAPDYPDTNAALTAAGVDGPRRYQLVTAGRAPRIARLVLLESILSDCRKVGKMMQ